jgi:hypothetical protein
MITEVKAIEIFEPVHLSCSSQFELNYFFIFFISFFPFYFFSSFSTSCVCYCLVDGYDTRAYRRLRGEVKSCALPFAVSALSFFFSFSYDNSFVFACIIAYYCNTLHTPSRRVTHIYIVTYTSFSAFFFFLFLSSFFFLPHTVPLHLFGFDF